jgi:hypothetical protein
VRLSVAQASSLSLVPVPWGVIKSTSCGPMPACASDRSMTLTRSLPERADMARRRSKPANTRGDMVASAPPVNITSQRPS